MATATWIKSLLDEQGVPYEERRHPEVFTAQEVAQREHVSGHRLAKVVALMADGTPVEAVLPASVGGFQRPGLLEAFTPRRGEKNFADRGRQRVDGVRAHFLRVEQHPVRKAPIRFGHGDARAIIRRHAREHPTAAAFMRRQTRGEQLGRELVLVTGLTPQQQRQR